MKWLTPLLLLLALAHILAGLYGLYAPDTLAPSLGLDMTTVGGRGEMRAIFGGLIAALGVMILRGSMGGPTGRQWLWAVATAYVGLAAGRLVSLGMDGMSAHTLFAGLLEGGLAVVMFWSGGAVGAKPVPAAPVGSAGPTADPVAPSPTAAPGSVPRPDRSDSTDA
jgi:hypothetical protein